MGTRPMHTWERGEKRSTKGKKSGRGEKRSFYIRQEGERCLGNRGSS